MSDVDKALVIAALILGILDFIHFTGPLSRVSAAGIGVVLLAIVVTYLVIVQFAKRRFYRASGWTA